MSISKNWPRQGQILEDSCSSAANCEQNKLDDLRNGIDDLDDQIMALLEKRFELSLEIGKTKSAMGRQILDSNREQIVLDHVSRGLNQSESKEFILTIFKSIMKESADFQRRMSAFEENKTRSERLFPNICIIGTGLIGGAFARQVKTIFPATAISAIDQESSIENLSESKLFDHCSDSLNSDEIKSSSLIVIACPPDVSLKVLREIAPNLRPGQLVVDLCSTKSRICGLANELDLNGAEFVGAHPFFGTEKRGFENSAEVVVSGRTMCLVPTDKSSELSIARLKNWFNKLELKVFITSASDHDRTVALTSHSIQLFASALGELIEEEIIEEGNSDLLSLSGGALAGLSRLMKSQSEMWSQISAQNKDNIRDVFSKIASRVDSLLDESENVSRTFAKASKVSDALTKH